MKSKVSVLIVFCLLLQALFVHAQALREMEPRSSVLELRRIAIYSSGVAYFEHSGNLQSAAEINLPFDAAAVNDALKSLVVNDPSSSSPSVRYAAENTLERTLKSLKIDLSGNPGIGEILGSLRGAELELSSPNSIRGRIIGVEYRIDPLTQQYFPPQRGSAEAWLSLSTDQGIRAIAIKDITSFRFIDESVNADLNRALDLIMSSRDDSTRNLVVNLNGSGNRRVTLSYVIPAPVWKVSYRLDLSGSEPFLQGWAIVDNDSDTDWKNVTLSLVTGRPVSFIQNLYPPYRLFRPMLPLSIAGIAESRTHDSGYDTNTLTRSRMMAMEPQMEMADEYSFAAPSAVQSVRESARAVPSVAGGAVETAAARAAGDQFEFTLKNPVSLDRRQSAMLPLVEGSVRAEKMLVFSGGRAQGGAVINPGISAELTNTSGMKLPAGPITVYDGGAYAGDALIEFFPENEKRLISYGEDLSVSGSVSLNSPRSIQSVNISGGVMTISRRQSYERTYTIRNASGEAKKLVIEHPITPGAELAEPASADDRTANLYRFTRNLAARDTLSFTVKEDTPLSERIILSNLRPESFLGYSTNQEIPANVRAALSRAIELRRKADDANRSRTDYEAQLSRFVSEQDRIRRNLEAAGNQSPQGQEYLRRLAALDNDIDRTNTQISAAAREAEAARKEYDDYLAGLSL